jgi:hypothetical protein
MYNSNLFIKYFEFISLFYNLRKQHKGIASEHNHIQIRTSSYTGFRPVPITAVRTKAKVFADAVTPTVGRSEHGDKNWKVSFGGWNTKAMGGSAAQSRL